MNQGTIQIKCAGFGGQGVLTLGEIVAMAAMRGGKNVSWLPSYGPESRGGTCNCDVILSEGDIAAPVIYEPDVAVIFNQPSLDRFAATVVPDGVVLYDSSLANLPGDYEGARAHGIPFTPQAIELGAAQVANMVALGAFVAVCDWVDTDRAVSAMQEKLKGKEKFYDINARAIEAGFDAARSLSVEVDSAG